VQGIRETERPPMNSAAQKRAPREFGIHDLSGGLFFSTLEEAQREARRNAALRSQLHHIRRAFDLIELDGIFCVGNRPTIFFKNYETPVDRGEANKRQRQAWNQGTATVLVLQDPQTVHLFSGMNRPSKDVESPLEEHTAWIESLDRTADTLEAFKLTQNVTSGYFYRLRWEKFDSAQAVDQELVASLGGVCDQLNGGERREHLRRVHAFLGRVIFTCYLLDRGIITLSDYHFIRRQNVQTLADLLKFYVEEDAAELLHKLFGNLKRQFNGSLFEYDAAEEHQWLIKKRRIELLRDFLQGDDMRGSQKTLGFWAYDFSVIPIETISAIYEEFLNREDPEQKEAKGAYYTPRFLAEMAVDEAVRGFKTLIGKRFLDPSCGSGIFLVILFNRIAEEWTSENPNGSVAQRIAALRDIMCTQLRGVDLHQTACRIASFSLYVAYLDQFDPPSLIHLKEEVNLGKRQPLFPPILAYRANEYRNTATPVVYEGDFFADDLPLAHDFDAIVGNPPWVSRRRTEPAIASWLRNTELRQSSMKSDGLSDEALFPLKQVAIPFMWKAPMHLKRNGHASFLVPSQVLLNQTNAFQLEWFRRVDVQRVVHLGDYREFLFHGARRPCSVITFLNRQPDLASARIEFFAPKVANSDPRTGLIPVSVDDRRWLPLDELVRASKEGSAPKMWKSHIWGTRRDLQLLQYLNGLPKLRRLTGELSDQTKRFTAQKGFKPWYQSSFDQAPDSYGLPKPIPGRLSDPCVGVLPSDTLLLLKEHCCTLSQKLDEPGKKVEGAPSKNGFHRSPNGDGYEQPLVIINDGFSKVVYSDFKVFYNSSHTGIHTREGDEAVLLLLCAFLQSRLAGYLAFHFGVSLGVQHQIVRLEEILDFPFPLPEDLPDPSKGRRILKRVAKEFNDARRLLARTRLSSRQRVLFREDEDDNTSSVMHGLRGRLEALVHGYFGLSDEEADMVADTSAIVRKSAMPSSPQAEIATLQPINAANSTCLERYANRLCGTLNRWAKADQEDYDGSPAVFSATYASFDTIGQCLVTLQLGDEARSPSAHTTPRRDEIEAVDRLTQAARGNIGPFTWQRTVIHGSSAAIRILKPAVQGEWTRIAALNDADQIFGAIVTGKSRRNR
jgi:N-6 DNA Methylase